MHNIADTPYICDYERNQKCRKTACIKYGGPCMATLDKKYAKLDENGHPIEADDVVMRAAADVWAKQ